MVSFHPGSVAGRPYDTPKPAYPLGLNERYPAILLLLRQKMQNIVNPRGKMARPRDLACV